MQINLPVTMMEQLAALAREDHRDARRQAEFYVCRAIIQALGQRAMVPDDTHRDREIANALALQD
jgi:hypothetical protein